MKIAIIGVTGMVGREMLEVLSERNFSLTNLIPVASENLMGELFFLIKRSIRLLQLMSLCKKRLI